MLLFKNHSCPCVKIVCVMWEVRHPPKKFRGENVSAVSRVLKNYSEENQFLMKKKN